MTLMLVNDVANTIAAIGMVISEISFTYPILNFGYFGRALAKCADWISSLPARSAIVRTSFTLRVHQALTFVLQFAKLPYLPDAHIGIVNNS